MTAGALLITGLCTTCLVLGANQQTASPASLDATIDQAFQAAYNLDQPAALTLARRAVATSPAEPKAHRTLAAVLMLEMLFRRGAVSVDHYMAGMTRMQASLQKPPQDLESEFRRALARAIELADARRKHDPADLDALYELGTAYALQATFIASIEGSMRSALRSAKLAFDAQEEVLERDPKRAGAGLVVGTYRYLVSALSLPTRLLAYVVGFGGGKQRGISLLEEAARDPNTYVDAQTALMLVYSREGRHDDVVRIAQSLAAEYPRNRLFVLEAGAAAVRAGRAVDANAILTRGLGVLDRDERPKMPGERAVWLYKRAMARVLLKQLAEAQADLDRALQSDPQGWVRGRIHIEIGKIADLSGRRREALAAYQTARSLCELHNDPLCIQDATRLTRRAYESRLNQ